MKSTTHKPTVAARLLGFLAVAAIVAVHVRAVRLAIEDLTGEPREWSTLDSCLGIWGVFVLHLAAVVLLMGSALLVGYLVAMGFGWIVWAVTNGVVTRPGGEKTVADEAGEEDDDWFANSEDWK